MVFATEAAAAVDAISQRFRPAAGTAEDAIRQARRAMVRGQYAAEDATAAAALLIRRRPLTAVAAAAGAGALVGGIVGLAVGAFARCKAST
jgi:ElaB/YqjD/DUF883 family membrane-anchored ribosome-binding protein